MRALILIFIGHFLFLHEMSLAQGSGENSPALPTVLSHRDFITLVKEHHPLARQARLLVERAGAQRLQAAGNFDPELFAQSQQKYFDGSTYYRLGDYGLKIPTWFGLTGQAGYELNDGVFLNPQENVPASGLWYGELALTLGRGLFIDQRRASLRQAKLLQDAAGYEVALAYNKLLQDALTAYWEWYRSEQVYQTYQEAVELARQRLNQVRIMAEVEELAPVDTLEAYIQWQNRNLRLQEAVVERTNARQSAETYLWWEGEIPLEIDRETRPQYDESLPQPILPENWQENHPRLRSLDYQMERQKIEQNLQREFLKPQVDLHYRFLNEPALPNDFFSEYAPGNYAWGLRASFPLFLRQERGRLQAANLNLRNTRLERDFAARQLANTVEAQLQELATTRAQLSQTRQLVANTERLWQAEITQFENGESSLFLINQRELYYLDSREREITLEARWRQVLARLRASAGAHFTPADLDE